jgi:hypothetical protein
LGLSFFRMLTQGCPALARKSRATLGFGAESRWDSQNVDVKHPFINGLILRARGYIFGCEIGQKAFQFLFTRQMSRKTFEATAGSQRGMAGPVPLRGSRHSVPRA